MPAPATADELLELVQKSGVADEARLRAYIDKLTATSAVPADPGKLAAQLVRDGLLTYFQAEQLLQGKWKRFTLGKYKVLEKIGSGGMGQVFLCEHKLMRRRVAVKVLPTAKAEDEASRARFYREARAVAALDHPNIVRAYDIDQDDNLHFIVMEYVDGTNLQELVKKVGPLDVTRACHYVYGAAVGLEYAHGVGLVHRDIKPGNVLIDRSGVVKILDMGLARFFHDEEDNLTRMNDENVLGTADYLAPEQAIDSHTVDIRADIYSLGSTFYFLLTGQPPFPDGTVAQKLIWHQHRDPRPVRAVRPDVPEGVAAVVARMMAKKPEDRYQTPAAVVAALAPWVATPIPPPSDKELPQLSPAAMGGAAARGPTSVVVRVPGTGAPPTMTVGGMPTPGPFPAPNWTGDSSAHTKVARPPDTEPLPLPPPEAGNGVWADLASDTPAVVPGDTLRPDRATPSPRPGRRPAVEEPHARRWLTPALVVGGVLALGVTGALYLAWGKKKTPQTSETTPETPAHRLVVSKAAGDHHVATLREALARARPGDTVVIAEDRLSEPALRLADGRGKNLTIESGLPGGRPPVIEFAAKGGGVMLRADGAEGLRLRNLEFDGKGSAEIGVTLVGQCPGAVVENVTVRGTTGGGVKLLNVAGEPGRPVALDRVRVVGPLADVGVALTAFPGLETRRVVVRGCRVEGPGKAGVRVEGAAADVEVTGNRFFKIDAAVAFGKPPDGKSVQGQVSANTGYELNTGVLFDFPPPDLKGRFALVIDRNFFGRTQSVLRSGGPGGAIPGVAVHDNGYDRESKPGNFPSPGAMPMDAPKVRVNPADDATFLHFPPGPPPTVGPNRVEVGAR